MCIRDSPEGARRDIADGFERKILEAFA